MEDSNKYKNEYHFFFSLKLYLKLFIIMGVTWIFELSSWAYPGICLARIVSNNENLKPDLIKISFALRDIVLDVDFHRFSQSSTRAMDFLDLCDEKDNIGQALYQIWTQDR